jgi:hypothetical protein
MLPLPLFTFRNFAAANLVTAFVYGALRWARTVLSRTPPVWPLPRAVRGLRSLERYAGHAYSRGTVPSRRPMIRQHSSVPAPQVAFARRLRTEARYKHQRSVRMLRVPEPVNW